MARIQTYNIDTKVTSNDTWIGSDGDNYNQTKNFSPRRLAAYFNSSEEIHSANSIAFKYQTLDINEDREPGTISFKNNNSPTFNFSSISNIMFSKISLGMKDVDVFLLNSLNKSVILHKSGDINKYGLYQVVGVSEDIDEPNFLNFQLLFFQGNSFIEEDKEYLFSIISLADQKTNTSQLINDGEDGINPFITLQDVPEVIVPTNTSDLTNDGEDGINPFITLEDIPEVIVPTKTSDLTNDGEDGINPFITLEDIPVPEIPTLESVLAESNITNGNDISISDGDEITFDNGSRIRKGLTDAGNGGAKGVALVCSLDYELKWEAGRQYVMQQDGFTIREVSHNFTIVPTATDDDTKGFVIGSRWILDNGDVYECTDATEDNAVWELRTVDVPETTRYVTTFSATEGQTVFTVTQPLPVGYFDVYLNGVKINEFTSTDFTVTLDEGAILNDIIDIVSYNVLSLTSRDTRRNAIDSVDVDTNYCGVAPADALETDEVWTITKIVVAEDGSVVTTFAYDVAWIDRETTIYT
jgi:hypothetical protein